MRPQAAGRALHQRVPRPRSPSIPTDRRVLRAAGGLVGWCVSDNAGVIVNPKGEMKGSAVTGPIAKEVRTHACTHAARLPAINCFGHARGWQLTVALRCLVVWFVLHSAVTCGPALRRLPARSSKRIACNSRLCRLVPHACSTSIVDLTASHESGPVSNMHTGSN